MRICNLKPATCNSTSSCRALVAAAGRAERMGMYYRLGPLAVIILGTWWCVVVFKRLRSDLEEYRTTRDATTRQGLAIIWGLTVVILTVTVWCAWSVAVRLVRVL